MLTTVEKVLFLQDIDFFEHVTTEDLSHIAAVTEEVEYEPDREIFREGGIPDALYLVIDGKVRLTREGREVMVAGAKDVFGAWSLFDDEPQITTAKALEKSHMLRIDKEDFIELLADHVAITQSILKTLVRRLRRLMIRVAH
jgi:CRP-like cAMP-binding protein